MSRSRRSRHEATATRIARLEAEVLAARRRHERFRGALARLEARRDDARACLLRGASAPLSLVPIFAAVVATMAALAATLCAYATTLIGSSPWTRGGLYACIVAVVASSCTRIPGAGGAARLGLGRLAFALTLVASVVLVYGGLAGPR